MTLSLTGRISRVLRDRRMLYFYAKWLAHRVLGRSPSVSVIKDIQLRHWTNFSEYWTFRNGIPRSEKELLQRLLLDFNSAGAGIVFDVGANTGLFTCALAGLGADAVHAFEPIPETFLRLKSNLYDNGLLEQCKLNCLAVGADHDLVEFHFDERSAATSRLVTQNRRNSVSCQSVAVISLDEYCELRGIDHIGFLKIDVEGMEPYVLQGAHRLLANRQVASILIEVCPANLRSVGLNIDDLIREIEASGYAVYELSGSGQPGRTLEAKDLRQIELDNVLLLPD